MSDEERSLQEEIRAAFEQSQKEEAEQSDVEVNSGQENQAVEENAEGEKAKLRDDKGRFKVKDEDKPETPETEQEEPVLETEAPNLSKDRAPSSWSPTVREKWSSIPEDVRAEIIRREEASALGVRKLQDELAPVRQLADGLQPYLQEARQAGLDANMYVQRTMAAERALRNPDPAQRFEALLSVADTYGIPLRQYLGGQQPAPQPQVPAEIQRQLEEQRAWMARQEEQTIEREINSFKDGKEFFEDVRSIMGDLIESGRAKGLEDAYEQACWMSPEVRKVLISREKSGGTQDVIRQRQEAAQRVNLKTTSNVNVTPQTDPDADDIESIVRSQFTKSGRM